LRNKKREGGERECKRRRRRNTQKEREKRFENQKEGKGLPASTIDFAMKVTSLKYQDLLILKLISLWSLHYLNIVFLTKQ
jgi:hypothetical protein